MKSYVFIKSSSKFLIYFCLVSLFAAGGLYISKQNAVDASSSCGVGLYKQWDSRWGGVSYVQGFMADVTKKNRNTGKTETTKQPATIATSGCGPTSLAMVVNYLSYRYYSGSGKPEDIEPQDTAAFCYAVKARTNGGGTSSSCFKEYAQRKGYKYETISRSDTAKIKAVLGKGMPLIALVGPGHDNKYTFGGHYIVLYGISGNNVLIHDPNHNSTLVKTLPI